MKDREAFVNHCIEVHRSWSEGQAMAVGTTLPTCRTGKLQFLEVMPDGLIRRGIIGTMVHIAEPTDPGDEDLSDVAVLQSDWIHDPDTAGRLQRA